MQIEDSQTIEPEFLRPPQAARLLGISRSYLSHLTSIGAVPVYRLGSRCVRYHPVELILAMYQYRCS